MTLAEKVHLHYPSFLTTFVRQKCKTRGHNDVRLYDISVSFNQLKFRTTFCARACTNLCMKQNFQFGIKIGLNLIKIEMFKNSHSLDNHSFYRDQSKQIFKE